MIKLAGKRRFSTEYTMLSILEYLSINSLNAPVSKYHILNKTPGIRQQRQDRVSDIMSILEANGFINSIKTSSNSTFYQITKKGIYEYTKWVKDFLDFARSADIQKNGSDDRYS
jgi:predicted transcriptional regulator